MKYDLLSEKKKYVEMPMLISSQDIFQFHETIKETKKKYKILEEHYSFPAIAVQVPAKSVIPGQVQMVVQNICTWYAVAGMMEQEKKNFLAGQQIVGGNGLKIAQ